MNILLDVLYEIEINLDKISSSLKEKYKDIDWNIIKKEKDYIEGFCVGINLGKAWLFVTTTLKEKLLNKLIFLLEEELPSYYRIKAEKMAKDND